MLQTVKCAPAKENARGLCAKTGAPLLEQCRTPKAVRRLAAAEVDERFGRNWRLSGMFSNSFEIGGDVFGLSFWKKTNDSKNAIPEEKIKGFLELLHNAVERLRGITKIPDEPYFPICFVENMQGFGTFSGFGIDIGLEYPQQFADAPDCAGCGIVRASVESQYFHELLHRVRLDRVDEDRRELFPMMGEFLYDPAKNIERNSVFVEMGSEIVRILKKGMPWCFSGDRYLPGWVSVSRILLFEAKELGAIVPIPGSLDAQLEIFGRLPELFASFGVEERDGILKRYLPLSIREIEEISLGCGQRLGLLY